MSLSRWPLLSASLRAPLNPAELEEINQTSQTLAERLVELNQRGQPLNVAALQAARLQASNTLRDSSRKDPTDIQLWIQHWEKTLLIFNEHLLAQQPLTLELLEKWNRQLRNDFVTASPYRVEDVYLTEKKLLPSQDISEALKELVEFVLAQDEDVVLIASRVYQWLITIHPFPNANGRTARLAADYILMSHGYLPLVFPSPQGSFVAISPDHPHAVTPMQSFQRVARAIERSLEILQLPKDDTSFGSGNFSSEK